MSTELTLFEDADLPAATDDAKLDVTIFEGEETPLDVTAQIASVECDIDLSRMVYLIHYLDANNNVLLRREIDYYEFKEAEFARQFNRNT